MDYKKYLIDAAMQNGTLHRVNMLLQLQYMMISECSILQAEIEKLLSMAQLDSGELKHRLKHADGAIQMLSRTYSGAFKKEHIEDWCADVTQFEEIMFKWNGIPRYWKPGDDLFTESVEEIVMKARDMSEYRQQQNKE